MIVLNDERHWRRALSLIRNELIGLPAMQHGARSGCFRDGDDKEISWWKDDAELLRYKCQLKPVRASIIPWTAIAYWKALSHTITGNYSVSASCKGRSELEGEEGICLCSILFYYITFGDLTDSHFLPVCQLMYSMCKMSNYMVRTVYHINKSWFLL